MKNPYDKRDMANSKFIVSLDFELLWGMSGFDSEGLNGYAPHVEGSIKALRGILEVLKRHGVKATIGYVGVMRYSGFDEYFRESEKVSPKPTYTNPLFSSYNLLKDNKQFLDRPELFFCPDVINQLEADKSVELASHTYSHYYCLEQGQTPEQFEADMRMALEINGKPFRTIIFPRNQTALAYLDICRRYGFTHYRGIHPDSLYRDARTKARYSLLGAKKLLDTFFNVSGHKTSLPLHNDGEMVAVPGSTFNRPYSTLLAPAWQLKIHRIKASMLHAAKEGEIYQIWWHPHNFGTHLEKNLKTLDTICQYYEQLHKEYGMQSCFIKDI